MLFFCIFFSHTNYSGRPAFEAFKHELSMFSFEVVLNYNRDTRASNKFLNDRDFKILPRHCVQISSLTLDDYTTKPLLHIKLTMLHYTNIFYSEIKLYLHSNRVYFDMFESSKQTHFLQCYMNA